MNELLAEWVVRFAAVVALCGAAGALIDFYIGERGQKIVRSLIETWLIKFSYIRPSNFGRLEARFSYGFLKAIYGTFFSLRRVFYALTVLVMSISSSFILFLNRDYVVLFHYSPTVELLRVFVAVLMLSVSISISIRLSRIATNLLQDSFLQSVAYVVVIIGLHIVVSSVSIIITVFGSIVALSMLVSFASGLRYGELSSELEIILPTIFRMMRRSFGIDPISGNIDVAAAMLFERDFISVAAFFILMIGAAIRMVAFSFFVICWILLPIHSVLEITIRRIAEEKKPVFTYLFTGIAAAAKLIGDVHKLYS